VERNGRLFAAGTFGYSDREQRIRTQLGTRYRISGLTNTFTWIGLLQLQDAHRFDLDRSVCTYVPRCPAAWRPLTARDLMVGQSGLKPLPMSAFSHRPPSLAQYVDRLRSEKLIFNPGTMVAHGNSHYSGGSSPNFLAARLLEWVSGEQWVDYVRRHIFRPSGMTSTGFQLEGRDAVGYGRDGAHKIVRRPLPGPTVDPPVDLGLWSTVLDALRLDRALRSGRLLSKASPELDGPALARDRRRGSGPSCCWIVGKQFGHQVEITGGHGFGDGFYTVWERYPAEAVAVFVFTNFGGSGPAFQVADLAASVALGEYPAAVPLPLTALIPLAGTYQYDGRQGTQAIQVRVTLRVVRGGLSVVGSPGIPDLAGPLVAASDSTFVARYTPAYQLEFQRGPDGSITGFVFKNPNWSWRLKFRRVSA
jgi:CubicO group peptidase (beta-lactamase class C family)